MKLKREKEVLDLLPCPFCGSMAKIVHSTHIKCSNIYNCDCETRLGINAWNRRATRKRDPEGVWA